MSRFKWPELNGSNPENLIHAVEKHPCLWNSLDAAYKKKNCNTEAWKEIGRELLPDWDAMPRVDQHNAISYLMKRWRNIRDYYNKELNMKLRKGPSHWKRNKRKYVFAHLLKFLQPELEMRITKQLGNSSVPMKVEDPSECEDHSDNEENSITFVDTMEEQSYDSELSENPPGNCAIEESTIEYLEENFEQVQECSRQESLGSSRKLDTSEKGPRHTSTRNKNKRDEKQKDDADLMFLKSLLPDMKKLNDDEKFDFKYSIMQAYRDIMQRRKRMRNGRPESSS